MNQSSLKWDKKNDNNIKIEKINLFSEHFSMDYVLEQLFNKFDAKKHLLCDINNKILNSQRIKNKLNKYQDNLIHNQTNIILHTKYNYNKLANINYVKYYLPYCIQPKTNNTDICSPKKDFQKYTKKQNILREVNIKKKLTQYRIIEFIKKYTGNIFYSTFLKIVKYLIIIIFLIGKIKSDNILHKEVSKLYNKNSRIEIYLKNGKYNKTYFDIAIGNIVFFDCLINILLEDVTYIV
ncbi:hypothetical protein [Plasmodium yoelii yoelii]|uniref:Uncharacterized protein n=1 Tax=Plasmodium yoelii yoelii TaxID=73239 RepID=Q7RIL4_PLAYO|nr:hypothetical protein [Plasmodium yoelii yoelii]